MVDLGMKTAAAVENDTCYTNASNSLPCRLPPSVKLFLIEEFVEISSILAIFTQDCKLQTRCKICKLPHHTIIRSDLWQTAKVMPQVVLATVRVIVQTPFRSFRLRDVLDQGAQ